MRTFSYCFLSYFFLLQEIRSDYNVHINCNSSVCECNSIDPDERAVCPGLTLYTHTMYNKVEIQCEDNEDPSVYSALAGLRIKGSIAIVAIYHCPIPTSSFYTILSGLGIGDLKNLIFESFSCYTDTLQKMRLEQVSSGKTLNLYNNGRKSLPGDMFKGLKGLTRLEMSCNNVNLPKDIFKFTPDLELLVMKQNIFLRVTQEMSKGLSEHKVLELSDKIFLQDERSFIVNLKKLTSFYVNNIKNISSNKSEDLQKILTLDVSDESSQHFLEDESFNSFSALSREETVLNSLPNITYVKEIASLVCSLADLPENMITICDSLSSALLIIDNPMNSLSQFLSSNLKRLFTLDLSRNRIYRLDEQMFSSNKKLQTLDLSYNHLEQIHEKLFFHLNELTTLKLDHNRLKFLEGEQFSNLINLINLDISGNQLVSLLQSPLVSDLDYSVLQNCRRLANLQLSHNLLTEIYEDWDLELTSLTELELSNNNFSELQVLESNRRYYVSINLSKNHISQVNFPKGVKQNSRYQRFGSINLWSNPLNCDCNFLRWAKDLRNVSLALGFSSKPVISFDSSACKELQEEKEDDDVNDCIPSSQSDCPEGCVCKYRSFGQSLVVNCQHSELPNAPAWLPVHNHANHTVLNLYNNSLVEFHVPSRGVPGYQRVTHLNLANNNISSLHISDQTFSKLEKLDMSYNNISRINEKTLQLLESLALKRLELHNNPWLCDCRATRLVHFVQSKQHLIRHQVFCESGASMVTIKELCLSETLRMTYIVSATVVVLLASGLALTLLHNKYHRQMRVYCYSSRWPVLRWLVSSPDNDEEEDKEYDAFISFSHQDDNFVMNHLVPFLEESGQVRYKLCLHYRDWMPGETILSQVISSVKKSRRTIVVLSPHFLDSVWGVVEFRTAHSEALRDGTSKVIVILYKDVGPADALDEELRLYLQMNTYVKWESPWFWRQLAYAMPHHSVSRRTLGN